MGDILFFLSVCLSSLYVHLSFLREGNEFTCLLSTKVAPSLSHSPLPVPTAEIVETTISFRYLSYIFMLCLYN